MCLRNIGFSVCFLCSMQKQIEHIEAEIVQRLYKTFLEKFNGNKSEFARASKCSETTVRRVFGSKQRMTIDLSLRMCYALGIEIENLFKDLTFKEKS